MTERTTIVSRERSLNGASEAFQGVRVRKGGQTGGAASLHGEPVESTW